MNITFLFNHEPFNDNHYVNGRQYQVMCSDVVVPEENGRKINFSIKFETVELPFAESIGTSLELENDLTENYGRMIC